MLSNLRHLETTFCKSPASCNGSVRRVMGTRCAKAREAFSWGEEESTQLRKDAECANECDGFKFQVGVKERWAIVMSLQVQLFCRKDKVIREGMGAGKKTQTRKYMEAKPPLQWCTHWER